MSAATRHREQATGPAKRLDSLWVYALLALVATAGFFYVNLMAAIVDGLVTGLAFSNAQAGMVGAANTYGATAGALIAVFLVGRLRWKPVVVVLLAAMIGIDLLSTLVHAPWLMIALRGLDGLLGGMATGLIYAVMARTGSPDRAFGMLLAVQFGLGGLGMMLLPPLVPALGAKILFLSLAGVSCMALLAILAIPRIETGKGAGSIAYQPIGTRKTITVSLVMLGLFLFQAANMALLAFIIGLGEHAGLSRAFIGQALGWATWVAILGALLVVFMGERFGRFQPLWIAFVLTLVGTVGFYGSASGAIYFIANVGTGITWSFVVPYLFGMASSIDASGRLTSLAGFVSHLGLASGPLAAGLVLGSGQFHFLITAALAVLAASAAATLLAARRIDSPEHAR